MIEKYLESVAYFSPCRTWRYSLTRRWDMFNGRFMLFVGLNPSTADEHDDDPTIRRCVGFAKREEFGGIVMLNLFAFQSKKPKDMLNAEDPIGPENDSVIMNYDGQGHKVVAVWGNSGSFRDRDLAVQNLIMQPIYCFGLTLDGFPKHPLYLRADTKMILLQR